MVLIKSFLFAWLITNFQPLKELIKLLPEGLIKFYTQTLFTCIKCASFWTCLILSHDIYLASGTAFIAYLYDWYVAPKIKLN